MSRSALPLSLAAVAAVLAACNAIIGLESPTVRAESGTDAVMDATAGSDAPDVQAASDSSDGSEDSDAGSDDDFVPSPCSSTGACAADLTCATQFGLCEPSCGLLHACSQDAGWTCITPVDSGSAIGSCVGPDYACVGHVSYPPVAGATVTLVVNVVTDQFAFTEGTTVAACAAMDPACATPLATGIVDATGVVTLVVPNSGQGFTGYLDAVLAGKNEQLTFWSRPLPSGPVNLFTIERYEWAYDFPDADPSQGLLLVVAEACSSTPATTASLTLTGPDGGIGYEGPLYPYSLASTYAYALLTMEDLSLGNWTATSVYGQARIGTMNVTVRSGVLTSAVLGPTP